MGLRKMPLHPGAWRRAAGLWAAIIAALCLAYAWKNDMSQPNAAAFERVAPDAVVAAKGVPGVAIHFDPRSGFVFARGVETVPPLSRAELTSRLASRLGPPLSHRKGYT